MAGGALKTAHGASIGWKTGWLCCFHGSVVIHGYFLIQCVQGDSSPTSLPRMAGKSTSYGSFMPASNTPPCDFKILMTSRTCCTPSDLGYCVSVVLFCVILLTLACAAILLLQQLTRAAHIRTSTTSYLLLYPV